MITVIKKNGQKVEFDGQKVVRAIYKANDATPEHQRIGADKSGRYNQKIADAWVEAIANEIIFNIDDETTVSSTDIQNMVCSPDRIFVMLNYNDRVSEIPEVFQCGKKFIIIPLMQTDTRFVQDISYAYQA